MSMIEHAVGVVSLERFAAIDHMSHDEMGSLLLDTMAENAKLRELVSGLEYCAQGSVCDCCPLYDPSGTNHRRCESLERELGIEVGE